MCAAVSLARRWTRTSRRPHGDPAPNHLLRVSHAGGFTHTPPSFVAARRATTERASRSDRAVRHPEVCPSPPPSRSRSRTDGFARARSRAHALSAARKPQPSFESGRELAPSAIQGHRHPQSRYARTLSTRRRRCPPACNHTSLSRQTFPRRERGLGAVKEKTCVFPIAHAVDSVSPSAKGTARPWRERPRH